MYTLITAASSARAYKLKSSLGLTDIILGDYDELPAFMLASASMIKLPNPATASYAHEMLTLCLDRQINIVYALREEEAIILNTVGQLFKEYGITIISETDH